LERFGPVPTVNVVALTIDADIPVVKQARAEYAKL
jgi:hypothetical protein